MEIVRIEGDQWLYVKIAVDEYKAVIDQLEKNYLENPDYEPELVSEKMKDHKEKDFQGSEADEW